MLFSFHNARLFRRTNRESQLVVYSKATERNNQNNKLMENNRNEILNQRNEQEQMNEGAILQQGEEIIMNQAKYQLNAENIRIDNED